EADNGLLNKRGTIAMARTRIPDSATSQFFINHVDNTGLDYPKPDGHGYAVFGKVIEGMDVVDKIAATPVKRGAGPFANLPVETVEIVSVERIGQ
ncbi:MAG: peptidyl-prolyl cis-trans isomerase, partial [Desulfuromonadales bacterium]|nr:peptidyl-prolyl cis-trans isomerase [Desulfuromonadales bacterium]NIS40975.1 peptidyl-prolyl cis-trans isomerase [Desulfuromonadales bacterium]